MGGENRRPTWPFLCILVCLFVLAATAPKLWERATDVGPSHSRSLLAESVPEPEGASLQESEHTARTAVASPAPASVPEIGREAAPATVVDTVGPPLTMPQTEPTAIQGAEPADMAGPAIEPPSAPPEPIGEAGAEATALPGAVEAPTLPQIAGPAQPIAAPAVEPEPGAMAAEEVAPAPQIELPAQQADRPDSLWPEPTALLDQLDGLTGNGQTGQWARETATRVREFGAAVAEGSDTASFELGRLNRLRAEAEPMQSSLEDTELADRFAGARYALGRRLALWREVMLSGGLRVTLGEPTAADWGRLASRLERVNRKLGTSVAGRAWREYLAWERLEAAADASAADQAATRQVARETLARLTRGGFNARQRRFVASSPLAELTAELRYWAADPVQVAGLLAHAEQYERTGLPSDAECLVRDYLRLAGASDPRTKPLAAWLAAEHRDANLRVAVSEGLLNRFLPSRKPEFACVNDTILGNPVSGRSWLRSELAVRMIPDPQRARLAVEVRGALSSQTESTSGPATFYSDGVADILATKRLELDLSGIHCGPTEVAVENDLRLRGVSTDFDGIPFLGAFAQDMALDQHEKKQPEVKAELDWKVSTRAQAMVDGEIEPRVDKLNQRLRERVLEPLAALGLGPALLGAETGRQRLSMRLRLGGDSQMGGCPLRPWAPSDSLVSCQVHESAVNNFLQRLELDGARLTVAELREKLARVLKVPELAQGDAEHDEAEITFAAQDAVWVEFDQGQVAVHLAIARLKEAPHHWDNFQVRAAYRPRVQGRSVELVREDLIELSGELSTRSEIVLRGVFSKTFSKQRPLKLMPQALEQDPRLADVAVTQFTIDDGWIGVALGPQRGQRQPVVARRSDAEGAK